MDDKDIINNDGEEIKQEDESELPLSLSKKIIKFTSNAFAFIFFYFFYMMVSYPGSWNGSEAYHLFSIVPACFCIVFIYLGRRIK